MSVIQMDLLFECPVFGSPLQPIECKPLFILHKKVVFKIVLVLVKLMCNYFLVVSYFHNMAFGQFLELILEELCLKLLVLSCVF